MIGPKSSNFIKVDYPQPVDTLLSLIEVMKDPKAFDNHLKAIKEYTDKANKTIETLAKAEEVERLLTDAQIKHDKAVELYEGGSQEASKTIREAKEQADTLIAQTNEACNTLLLDAEQANKSAVQREKAAETVRAQQQKIQSQLDAANQAHQKREASLDKREQVVSNAEAVLTQLKTFSNT